MKKAFAMSLFWIFTSNVWAEGIYILPDGTSLQDVKRVNGTLPMSTLRILGITLNVTKMTEAMKVLGPAARLVSGDDPHDSEYVCLAAGDSSSVHLILADGSPEFASKELTAFTLSQGKPSYIKGSCTSSLKLNKSAMTDNGLHLGMTLSELIKKLGTPSKSTDDWAVYAFESYRDYTESERKSFPKAPGGGLYKGVYTYHDLAAHFADGKMDRLIVSVGGETSW